MAQLFRNRITFVWFILAAAALLSWIVGGSYAPGDEAAARNATVVLMVIAFVKVRLVIMHFMEAGIAPLPLRLVANAYVVGVCAAVLFMFFGATGS